MTNNESKRREFFKTVVDMYNNNDPNTIDRVDSIYMKDHAIFTFENEERDIINSIMYYNDISGMDLRIDLRYVYTLLYLYTHPKYTDAKIYNEIDIFEGVTDISAIYDNITDNEEDDDNVLYTSLEKFLTHITELFREDDHKELYHNDDYTILWYCDKINDIFIVYIDPTYCDYNRKNKGRYKEDLYDYINRELRKDSEIDIVYDITDILDYMHNESIDNDKYKEIFNSIMKDSLSYKLDDKYNIHTDIFIIYDENVYDTLIAILPPEKMKRKCNRKYYDIFLYDDYSDNKKYPDIRPFLYLKDDFGWIRELSFDIFDKMAEDINNLYSIED